MQNFRNSSTLPSERCKTIFEPTTTFSTCKEDPFGVSVSVILKIFRNFQLRFFKSKEFPGRSLDTAPNRQLVEYLQAEELESWFSAPGNFALKTCAPISSRRTSMPRALASRSGCWSYYGTRDKDGRLILWSVHQRSRAPY